MSEIARLPEVFSYHPSSSRADRPSQPWRLGAWLWATQGHILVAFHDDGSVADAPPKSMLNAQRYLDELPSDRLPVSLSVLRAFVGLPQAPHAKCSQCGGSGYSEWGDLVKCEHCGQDTRTECERCGGGGRATLRYRVGRMAGVPLNLELVAYALTFAPADGRAQIGTIQNLVASGRALVVLGDGWRVVVMGVKETNETMPVFVLDSSLTADAVSPLVEAD